MRVVSGGPRVGAGVWVQLLPLKVYFLIGTIQISLGPKNEYTLPLWWIGRVWRRFVLTAQINARFGFGLFYIGVSRVQMLSFLLAFLCVSASVFSRRKPDSKSAGHEIGALDFALG